MPLPTRIIAFIFSALYLSLTKQMAEAFYSHSLQTSTERGSFMFVNCIYMYIYMYVFMYVSGDDGGHSSPVVLEYCWWFLNFRLSLMRLILCATASSSQLLLYNSCSSRHFNISTFYILPLYNILSGTSVYMSRCICMYVCMQATPTHISCVRFVCAPCCDPWHFALS